jgi:hypothetical protein
MTVQIAQPRSVKSRNHACATLVLCLCAAQFVGACAERRHAPITWRGAGLSRPALPATVPPRPRPPAEESVDPVPDLRLELPPPPPLLAVRATPTRPHVAPPPAAESSAVSKPGVPIIAPQLTAAETSAAQQQMTSSLSVAEKNLARTQGKRLNATQTDLAAKVKGFIGDARSAGREGDWTRARSLATKAQVLSEELAASL